MPHETTAVPTLEYELTRADLDAFAAHHVAHAPHLARRIRRMRLVWAVVFTVIALEYARTSPIGALGFVGIAVAYLALYGRLNRSLYLRQMRGLHHGPEAPGVGPVKLTLAPAGLEIEGADGTARLRPSAVRRIDGSATHHFLYLGPSVAIVVPRSGIAKGDPDAFVRAVRAVLPET